MTHEFWPPTRPSASPAVLDDLLEVGPEGQHLGRHRPPDEDAIGVRPQPAALELEAIPLAVEDRPRLLARDPRHPLDEVVRHVRAGRRGSGRTG